MVAAGAILINSYFRKVRSLNFTQMYVLLLELMNFYLTCFVPRFQEGMWHIIAYNLDNITEVNI